MSILLISQDNKRNVGLDLLRSVAILMVMILHGNMLLPSYITEKISFFILDGVSIFFVLSGFLIGGIFIRSIEKENHHKLNFILNFWKKRWLRTIPNYYFILSLLIISLILQGKSIEAYYFKYYLFIQNLFWKHPNFYPEAWSLAVEEWFYLTVPLIILFFYKFSKNLKKTIFLSSFLIIIIVSILRYVKYKNVGITTEYDLEYRKIVLYRLDGLMYGVISAVFFHYYKNIWKKYKNIFMIIGVALLLFNQIYLFRFSNHFYLTNIIFIIEALSISFILPFIFYIQIRNKYIKYIIFHVAIISYSMYLINYSIVEHGLMTFINWNSLYISIIKYTSFSHTIIWILKYLTFWGLTILLSTLNYKYFEIPTMKLRDKI